MSSFYIYDDSEPFDLEGNSYLINSEIVVSEIVGVGIARPLASSNLGCF